MRNPSCIHFPLWQCCGGVVQLHLAGWVVMISPDWPDIYPAFKPQSSLFTVLLVTIIIVENLENLNWLFSWPPQPHLLRLYLPAADDDQLGLVFSFVFYSERHIRMCERGKEGAFWQKWPASVDRLVVSKAGPPFRYLTKYFSNMQKYFCILQKYFCIS